MITGIEGDIGQGKTLVMTHFAVQEYRRFRKPIVSNYHLFGIPHRYVTLDDLMIMVDSEEELRNLVLLIDELHMLADSRMSASKKNRLFSYFALQTGKEDVNFYYTTQTFGQVDIRIREQTRFGVHVRRKADYHLLTIRHMMKPHVRIPDAVVYGPDYYEFYDTREKVRIHRPNEQATA